MNYQKLFDYIKDTFNHTSLESEMQEIIHIVDSLTPNDKSGEVVDSIYQILGKFGKDREDIKSEFRKLCEHLKTLKAQPTKSYHEEEINKMENAFVEAHIFADSNTEFYPMDIFQWLRKNYSTLPQEQEQSEGEKVKLEINDIELLKLKVESNILIKRHRKSFNLKTPANRLAQGDLRCVLSALNYLGFSIIRNTPT